MSDPPFPDPGAPSDPAAPHRAGPAHAAALAAIHAAAFPPDEAWSAASLATLLAQPGCLALADPAGGMILIRIAGGEAEILTLAVAPAARRRGIARGLVARAMQAAARAGASVLFLEVSAVNAPAQALYAGAGFVPVGRRARYYADGADAVVMRAPAPVLGRVPAPGGADGAAISRPGAAADG